MNRLLTKFSKQKLYMEEFRQKSFFKSYYHLLKEKGRRGVRIKNSNKGNNFQYVVRHSKLQYTNNIKCKNLDTYAKIGKELYEEYELDSMDNRTLINTINYLETVFLKDSDPESLFDEEYYSNIDNEISKNINKLRNDKSVGW